MAEEKGSLFMQLVLMFQTAAMQQMGKVINPLTQKIEKDLSQAKFSIDMLGMIEEKTTTEEKAAAQEEAKDDKKPPKPKGRKKGAKR